MSDKETYFNTEEYVANDADALVGELFAGRLTVGEAIERLRTRLLDLSARNRLLNYRHPKGRCVQIANEPNINLVFDRLYSDGKGVPFKYVPEPSPNSYEGKRPEAKLYATRLGISTSFEFAPNPAGANGRRLHGIQALLYPAELERQLRKIASEAKTAIEETGTNMLFLVFGFLEFYDSEDSERPMLAPLISLPVNLVRGTLDGETRTYQYNVQYSGEDLAENQTLKEKLRRDFVLSIPEFGEEDKPETYFASIEHAVRNKGRWKVRRQITLGMFSFGKLAIWADLDTKKNPGLKEHSLIKSIFSGGAGVGGGGFHAEDYRIDEIPEATQPLIYDADSSQHSAIIDVLSGKNLVVNGPPGTGKSQTITNVIASALSKGKKILFVSEKLAALEVVRHRLNKAGLGHFCLELHSHKTQKKKFLEDIQIRIEKRFPAPPQFQAKLATLQRQKSELARYAELMGSCVRNALGLTVNEIFWAAERRRQELGDLSAEVNAIGFPSASHWTHDEIESRRTRLASLAEIYNVIGSFDSGHPWWGFRPEPLAPSDDEAIARVILQALEHARNADKAAQEAVHFFGLNQQPDTVVIKTVRGLLDRVPAVPQVADTSLLPRMFDATSDPKGQKSSRLLSTLATGVKESRQLFESAARVLVDSERLPPDEVREVRALIAKLNPPNTLLSGEILASLETVALFEKAVETFEAATRTLSAPYGPANNIALDAFLANCGKAPLLELTPFSISSIALRAAALLETANSLSGAVAQVSAIAARHNLPFDSSPDSIARLADPDGLPGLAKNTQITAEVLSEARRLAAFPLSDKSIAEIDRLKSLLEEETSACSDALARCRTAAERFGIPFDSTDRAVMEMAALAKVASLAPSDLLEYRRTTFGLARTAELIEKISTFLATDRKERTSLDRLFYLDDLPTLGEVKSALSSLRSKDGFFAFFDGEWRKARRLHISLCKEKRNASGRVRADELARLVSWAEGRKSFVVNAELKESFGRLFRGLETESEKISRLNDWYLSSRAALVECPGLTDKVNLTDVSSDRIMELAARANDIRIDVERLASAEQKILEFLGADVIGFHEAKVKGWVVGLESINNAVESFGIVVRFYSARAEMSLTPKDALRLMEARAELNEVSSDLGLLMRGERILREVGNDVLGRLADLAVGRWSEAITTINAQATLARDIASQAQAFVGEESPLEVAKAFAKAKLELDETWSTVASRPKWDSFKDWQELIKVARNNAATISGILERLALCARSGASANEVFAASDEEAEAQSILDRFANSEEMCQMLGDLFEGASTDLDRLTDTHVWGESICAVGLPAAVRNRLLSADARDALDTTCHLYDAMDAGCCGAKDALESLTTYGSFSWSDWQTQVRCGNSRDLPTKIKDRLEMVSGSIGSVLSWSKYLAMRNQARKEGLGDFVSSLEDKRMPAAALDSAFELAVYQSIGRSIYQSFPELSQFNGSVHEKTRSDYRALDAEIVSLTGLDFASQIDRRKNVPEGQRGMTVGDFTEMQLLNREINKQRRHIPIRQLVRRAGQALQELKPCFMMGPLSVAQYLEQGVLTFDLIVMDEASQLRPEEALGAVARGSQLVVVGDPKQLPPTSFFDRMLDSGDDEDDDDAPAAITGMESILDICQQLFTPVRSLRWHYRSHHESLIAFSNHHFYKNLIVFPSPYAKNPGLGVKYRYIKEGVYKDRQNLPEAQRIVDAVLEHMVKRPDESLGVVTLNQTQRELIEELLDKKLKTFKEGAEYLGFWEAEGWPFFIKNLENVQGDERDVVFISTTFGKPPGTDKVRQNFGPISRPDGWRRLNVLFTRSKRRIELFTSMVPEDIVVDERTPLGTKALRDYLDFAKRGVLVTTDENVREPDSDFEVSVANVITSLGYEVKPQLGVAGFFIDMAVRNPDRPGEFLAGIECDGATYHSGFSVRDRDRIRQEILESLGWHGRIHRIWSTDWFFNPRKETKRLINFLEERRRLSAIESPSEWEDEDFSVQTEEEKVPEETLEELAEVVAATSGDEDVFVEVGCRVTYCPAENPVDKHTILIVDSESNPKRGLINEQTPLAQALLGLSPGDVGELEIPKQNTRKLRVLKIQRD